MYIHVHVYYTPMYLVGMRVDRFNYLTVLVFTGASQPPHCGPVPQQDLLPASPAHQDRQHLQDWTSQQLHQVHRWYEDVRTVCACVWVVGRQQIVEIISTCTV